MKNIIKVPEKFLYEIWKEQNFVRELSTKDGQVIQVIDIGTENKEVGGPDFKNARIKIGNITYMGDVEIDSFYSDWKTHGHSINKRYNKVILHASFNNDANHSYVFTADGRKVQSIALSRFVKTDITSIIKKALLSETKSKINKMPCTEVNMEVSENEKLDFVYGLGIKRFKAKCDKMLERLKELSYLKDMHLKEPVIKYELDERFYNKTFTKKDFSHPKIWQQLVYELVFEALGYSKNKEIMKALARAVTIDFLDMIKIKEEFVVYTEAVLFNVAGLIPDVMDVKDDETSDYLRTIVEKWNFVKDGYDRHMFNSTQWHFMKLRPQNFPTIRLAGGARLINKLLHGNLIEEAIEKTEKIDNITKLTNVLRSLFIIKGDGYWQKHYVFGEKAKTQINYFLGASRADEILVNIILPVLSIYFEIFDKKELSQRAIKVYLNFYQKSENNLVNEVAATLMLGDAWKRSVLYQGMIELFRNYCSREKCLECEIGKKIFN